MSRCYCVLLICLACCFSLAPVTSAGAAPDILTIVNQSGLDLLNLRIEQGKEVSFIRLDMPPGAQDDIENPAAMVNIRADLGLMLDTFTGVQLKDRQRLVLCGEHPACLVLEGPGHPATHKKGQRRSLLPQGAAKPVCTLEQFRPGMTMQDVCALLTPDPPRDDNDAVLTGLGFADMLWAARLTPAQSHSADAAAQKIDEQSSRLGHLELWQPLTPASLQKLLGTLYTQGYAPWQAELPGLDMDFSEMADLELSRQKSLLDQALR
ncbi:MAG: peptidoglycan glycosyltransferase, partial [Desulfovibrionaceae bacterium]|nr:peptidoglycan glycosyltransferase [Desulfovibrionaceae bacterium]